MNGLPLFSNQGGLGLIALHPPPYIRPCLTAILLRPLVRKLVHWADGRPRPGPTNKHLENL